MTDLTTIFHHLQRQLFPALTDLGRFTRRYQWCGNGCPPHQRLGWRTLSSPNVFTSFTSLAPQPSEVLKIRQED
jgi:hypothetical protein